MSRAGATLLMVAAGILWSTGAVVTRHMEQAPALEQVFWRSLFAFLFVLVFLHWRQAPLNNVFRGPAFLSGAMWAVMFSAFVLALSMTSTANTLVVMSISPVITSFAAWIVLREPPPVRTVCAAVAAGVGIAWMALGDLRALRPEDILGMLVALMVPFAAATNFLILRSVARQGDVSRVDLVSAIMTGGCLSALAALPFALPLQASSRDIVLLAFLGVFQLGLPCVLLVVASRVLLAPEIALLSLLEVVLGPLWAWLGAGEVPARATLVGGSVVVAALIANEASAFPGRFRRTAGFARGADGERSRAASRPPG